MSTVHEKLKIINNLLLQDAPSIKNIGLLNGKMGISIYFFHLAKETNYTIHQKFAEQLIDDVYEEVNKNQVTLDFANGLAGIAWGIEHLVQSGFVKADRDRILSDVDDKLYQYIIARDIHPKGNSDHPSGEFQETIGCMLYILSRLKGRNLKTEDTATFIYKRLLINLTNLIGKLLDERRISVQEPLLFDILWDLPLCLILLSNIKKINICNNKIDQILRHLSPIVLSLYPRFPSNRLYLSFGIESILYQIHLQDWRNHANLLKHDILLSDILQNEFSNKNINIRDGVAGIFFIKHWLYELTGDKNILCFTENLTKKITTSEYWETEQDKLEKRSLGLLSGLAGIGLALLKIVKITPN